MLNEDHLRRLLRDFLDYYHNDRTHLSLGKDPPVGRSVCAASSPSATVTSPASAAFTTATSGERRPDHRRWDLGEPHQGGGVGRLIYRIDGVEVEGRSAGIPVGDT